MLSMQTLPSSSLPRQCICVCCLVELIGLAVFPAKQVAVLVSFWLHLCGCVSRLDRDDSVSSLPGAWPWLGDALAALSLVSHWPFGPTSDCVRVCERQIEKERASSGDQPESYRARMAMAANFTQYMMSWQNCSEAQYSSELMMHTFTLMHGKVSRCHLRGFACAKQSDMARFVLLIQYSPALCCSITSTSVVLCLVRGRPCSGGIRMCQMKCCGYLSHNCDESGNTLLLYIG